MSGHVQIDSAIKMNPHDMTEDAHRLQFILSRVNMSVKYGWYTEQRQRIFETHSLVAKSQKTIDTSGGMQLQSLSSSARRERPLFVPWLPTLVFLP